MVTLWAWAVTPLYRCCYRRPACLNQRLIRKLCPCGFCFSAWILILCTEVTFLLCTEVQNTYRTKKEATKASFLVNLWVTTPLGGGVNWVFHMGLHVLYLPCQIFAQGFITVTKLQLWSSNKNVDGWGQHTMRECVIRSQEGWEPLFCLEAVGRKRSVSWTILILGISSPKISL